jgi:hypothetical protein
VILQRRHFTREFKLEAVRLIKDRGVSCVHASEDPGGTNRNCAIGALLPSTIAATSSVAVIRFLTIISPNSLQYSTSRDIRVLRSQIFQVPHPKSTSPFYSSQVSHPKLEGRYICQRRRSRYVCCLLRIILNAMSLSILIRNARSEISTLRKIVILMRAESV